MADTPHWLWQQQDWPQFAFAMRVVSPALNRARGTQGRVLGKAQALGLANLGDALAEIWVEEATATARIEGEKLDLNSVRSSVERRLGLASVGTVSRAVEGLIDLMDDATRHWREPLTVRRLCRWQAALFPTGFAGIRIASEKRALSWMTPAGVSFGARDVEARRAQRGSPPALRLRRRCSPARW